MILHIHDNLLVSDLQERFSKCFPLLKLEFYRQPHTLKKRSAEEFRIDPSKRVGEIRHIHDEGGLELKSWFTICKVETDLRKKFGLNAQVFRNENGSWVQTSGTDKFTLAQQQGMSQKAKVSVSPKFNEQLSEYEEL